MNQDKTVLVTAQVAESEMIDSIVLYAVTSGAKIFDAAWVLDSTCSFHIFSERESLATYKAIKDGKAPIGNGMASKILRVSTVNI